MKRFPILALCLLVSASFAAGCRDRSANQADEFEKVEQMVKAHDYPGAVRTLEAMRQAKGNDPKVIIGLVNLYRAQGEPARAILRARETLAAQPDAKVLYLPLADLYIDARQYPLAKAVLLEARKQGVDDKEVAGRLGTCLGKMNDPAGARAEFERAQAAGLEEKIAKYNLALVYLQEKDFAHARAMLEEVVAKNPDYAFAKRELAHLMLDQAILDARDAKVVDMDKVKQAMDMLWTVIDELKDDWRIYEAMGDGWLLKGDYDAAVAAYTDALRLGQNPKSVEDRYRVAKMKQNEVAEKKKAAEAPK